jgi:hypothetical protein
MKTLREYISIVESSEKLNDEWFKDGGFKTFKVPAREPFEVATADGEIDTLEGPVKYKKGFYIMTGPKGEQYPITPEKFDELKADNGDGTASPKKIIKIAKLADHDGAVNTSWGEVLNYTTGEDFIVRHGEGDYGVVKKDIFKKTYNTDNT